MQPRSGSLLVLVFVLNACRALVLGGVHANMNLLERPSTPLFCLNVCLRVKPERRDEFLRCIRANQEGTLTSEALAVTYVYGEDEKESNTWRFFEQYLGREGFEAHRKTPHFADWELFAATEPFTAPPDVKFFVEDSATSVCTGAEAVREVLTAGDFTKLFCLDVQLSVKPDSREAFLNALRSDQRGALTSEPLAVSYLPIMLIGPSSRPPSPSQLLPRWATTKSTYPLASRIEPRPRCRLVVDPQ